jgi:hypothetical protein
MLARADRSRNQAGRAHGDAEPVLPWRVRWRAAAARRERPRGPRLSASSSELAGQDRATDTMTAKAKSFPSVALGPVTQEAVLLRATKRNKAQQRGRPDPRLRAIPRHLRSA